MAVGLGSIFALLLLFFVFVFASPLGLRLLPVLVVLFLVV